VTFTAPGSFGYVRLAHSPMKGAIEVIAAAPRPVPALSHGPTVAVMLALLAIGLVALSRGRRARWGTGAPDRTPSR
jgi:hypothetical protein